MHVDVQVPELCSRREAKALPKRTCLGAGECTASITKWYSDVKQMVGQEETLIHHEGTNDWETKLLRSSKTGYNMCNECDQSTVVVPCHDYLKVTLRIL